MKRTCWKSNALHTITHMTPILETELMKMLSAVALALAPLAALVAAPALADDHVEASAAALSVNSPIAALMADASAKAVVVKHLGPLDEHPMYEQFKAMTLKEVAPFSQGMITDETIEKIKADLAARG